MQPLITFIGILIAAFFSRKQYRKTRIAKSELESYTFEKKNFERFKNLTITLNDTQISNDLSFIKGLIFVVGQNDIAINPEEIAITIIGNNDSIVKDFKIIKSSFNFKSNIEGNAVNIYMKNLKVDDFILYEIICENLKSPLNVQSRILNASRPFKISYSRLNVIRSEIRSSLFFGLVFLCLTFWPMGFKISRHDFDVQYYYKGDEIPEEVILNTSDSYLSGYNFGISKAHELVNRFVKDSSIGDRIIANVGNSLDLLKIDTVDHAGKEYKEKADRIIDSLINKQNRFLFFVLRDYREKHYINDNIEVSFKHNNSFSLILTICILLYSLFHLLFRAGRFIWEYYKYFRPLEKLLENENIEH